MACCRLFPPAQFPPASSPPPSPRTTTPRFLLLCLRPIPYSTTTTIFSTHKQPTPFPSTSNPPFLTSSFPFPFPQNPNLSASNGNNSGNGNGGGNWYNPFHSGDGWSDNDSNSNSYYPFVCLFGFCCFQLASSVQAKTNEGEVIWEVKGGKWIKLVPDYLKDVFVNPTTTMWSSSSSSLDFGVMIPNIWIQCKGLFMHLMLPEGFPHSVTSDYLEYSLWRGVQGVAAQISGVLATQALLYAVGLGKGAIPTAAAVNWVLKDGIGYLSKILLSNFGRHFDVNPKGWRLFADFLENAAYGMEILTPAFPHLFVPIGAVAGAGRSASALIQASTRSCFYAGFAAQRNFAEVIAKGEAQGMVSKAIGIGLGIALANCIHSSVPLALGTFGVVTWVHMYCNLKSYQSIQLRTLNPYRASLVFGEYLLSGLVPSVNEVNAEEPFFPTVPLLNLKSAYEGEPAVLSSEAKDTATNIECRLQMGSKLSSVVKSREDVLALFDLYRDEGYILTEHEGRFCVILKESSSPQDMLKSLFHVNYLYWLEKYVGIKSRSPSDDCRPGGKLQISLEYVQREFDHVRNDGELAGWVTDGLIARPLPNRILPGNVSSTVKC
ncbi:hypothetical protein LguiB_028346 [Lonicera macranthoides]